MFSKSKSQILKIFIFCLLLSSCLLFLIHVKYPHKLIQKPFNENGIEKIDEQQKPQKPRFFICPYKFPGAARLGNLLFLFGSLFGIAKKFKGKVLMPVRYSRQLKQIFRVESFLSDSFSSLKGILDKLQENHNIDATHNYADVLCGNVWKRVFEERWASRFDGLTFKFITSKLASMECSDDSDAGSGNTHRIACNDKKKEAVEADKISNDTKINQTKKKIIAKYIDKEPEIPIFGVGRYLQSFKYFEEYREELLKSEFKFHDWIKRRSGRIINFAKQNAFQTKPSMKEMLSVAIHVRRTDMGSASETQRGYTVATIHYINKSMEYFSAKFQNQSLLFIVVTDDIVWCRKNVRSASHAVVFSNDLINTTFSISNDINNHHVPIPDTKITQEASDLKEETLMMKLYTDATLSTILDLAIISSTDHCILTVGSYGWWGAYLNSNAHKIVTHYSNYPLPNSEISKTFLASDYYPHEWVGLS